MIITIGFLLAGFLLGLLLKGRVKLPTSAITLASICLLLFILGLEIGGNRELLANLPTMGLTALVVSVLAILGSVFFARLFTKKEELASSPSPAETGAAQKPSGGMRDSLIIVGCFVAGVLVALAGWVPEGLPMDQITEWGLYLLLVCVGFGLGMEEGFFASLKTLPLRSLLLPLVTVVGSLTGGLLAWGLLTWFRTSVPDLILPRPLHLWYTDFERRDSHDTPVHDQSDRSALDACISQKQRASSGPVRFLRQRACYADQRR